MLINRKVLLYLMLFLISGGIAMGSMEFLFSNKKYKKHIKINVYLVSEEQISHVFFANEEEKLNQESYKELYGKKAYIFICLKNIGDRGAWGVLNCKIEKELIEIYINRVPFKTWDKYLIPFTVVTWNGSNDIPKIETEWKELYTK